MNETARVWRSPSLTDPDIQPLPRASEAEPAEERLVEVLDPWLRRWSQEVQREDFFFYWLQCGSQIRWVTGSSREIFLLLQPADSAPSWSVAGRTSCPEEAPERRRQEEEEVCLGVSGTVEAWLRRAGRTAVVVVVLLPCCGFRPKPLTALRPRVPALQCAACFDEQSVSVCALHKLKLSVLYPFIQIL